jgi:hypothetical protein
VCDPAEFDPVAFSPFFSRLLTAVFPFHSGLARTFGRAAFARPTPIARRVPSKINGLPSLARFASSEAASVGKIHQVIGAVVDGMFPAPDKNPVTRLRENLFLASIPSQKSSTSTQ